MRWQPGSGPLLAKARWAPKPSAWPPPRSARVRRPEEANRCDPPARPGDRNGRGRGGAAADPGWCGPLRRIGQSSRKISSKRLAHQSGGRLAQTVWPWHHEHRRGPSAIQVSRLGPAPAGWLRHRCGCSPLRAPCHLHRSRARRCHRFGPADHVRGCALRCFPPDRQTARPTSAAQGHSPSCGQSPWLVSDLPVPWGPNQQHPTGQGAGHSARTSSLKARRRWSAIALRASSPRYRRARSVGSNSSSSLPAIDLAFFLRGTSARSASPIWPRGLRPGGHLAESVCFSHDRCRNGTSCPRGHRQGGDAHWPGRCFSRQVADLPRRGQGRSSTCEPLLQLPWANLPVGAVITEGLGLAAQADREIAQAPADAPDHRSSDGNREAEEWQADPGARLLRLVRGAGHRIADGSAERFGKARRSHQRNPAKQGALSEPMPRPSAPAGSQSAPPPGWRIQRNRARADQRFPSWSDQDSVMGQPPSPNRLNASWLEPRPAAGSTVAPSWTNWGLWP